MLVPFALAILGRWRVDRGRGVVALALAIASGCWDGFAGSDDHLLRVAIVAAGSVLATSPPERSTAPARSAAHGACSPRSAG